MFSTIRDLANKTYKEIYAAQWGKVINQIRVPSVRIANPPESEEGDEDLLGVFSNALPNPVLHTDKAFQLYILTLVWKD